jgi:hypothetical protein
MAPVPASRSVARFSRTVYSTLEPSRSDEEAMELVSVTTESDRLTTGTSNRLVTW